ncbi:MAG TPA: hypothetical protein VGX92_00920 [Pyrinomonadaceae bacterium]|nr:hypothetical protein [Pyrinomonadaceae bacterium]
MSSSSPQHQQQHRRLILAFITRIVLAAMLALALLAGVAPFDTLSSAQETCTMSCCAGKPTHRSGSCSAAFAGAHSGEREVSAEHEHSGAVQTPADSTVIVEAASPLCGTEAAHSTKKDAAPSQHRSRHASRSAARVIAHVLTTPCSPECAAVAASAFAQVRRPRDAAATLTSNSRPRPPNLASPSEHVTSLQTPGAVAGRQSRPRAPPLA